MPYFAASSRPASSAVTIVMRSGVSPPTWRRISGSTPWPMLPKPMKTRRPGKVRVDRVLAHDVRESVILDAKGAECTANPRRRGATRWGCSPPTASPGSRLAIDPVFRKDWLLENAIVFAAIPLFVLSARRLRFSDFAYTCLFIFFVSARRRRALHLLARPVRRLVAGSSAAMPLEGRNHYDRLVHFVYGLLVTPAAVELFAHYGRYARPWDFLFPWMFMAGHAVIYELIEFAAAVAFGGDLGQAYLGTQGDIWDGQKDMALALAGTTIMLAALAAAGRLPTRRGPGT